MILQGFALLTALFFFHNHIASQIGLHVSVFQISENIFNFLRFHTKVKFHIKLTKCSSIFNKIIFIEVSDKIFGD